MRALSVLLVLTLGCGQARSPSVEVPSTPRILYVEHPPKFEYRHLVHALTNDPTMLVHVLLTSADSNYAQEHSHKLPPNAPARFAQPICEFPKTMGELLEYDVLILGDVDPGTLGGEAVWANIEKFVVEFGRGLVLIAGTRSNPESFRGTALENLLPIVPFDRPRDPGPFEKPLPCLTTDAGKTHRVTQFSPPGLFWFKPVASVSVSGTVLMELDANGKRVPLFVAATCGKGKVFLSLTDETWRWRINAGDEPLFYPFWKRVIDFVRPS